MSEARGRRKFPCVRHVETDCDICWPAEEKCGNCKHARSEHYESAEWPHCCWGVVKDECNCTGFRSASLS